MRRGNGLAGKGRGTAGRGDVAVAQTPPRGNAGVARLDGWPIVAACRLADTPLARLRGLFGRRPLAPGEGLLLRPCASVHTAFLPAPIDVVFLDGDGRVLRAVEGLRPWRVAGCRRARQVLELPAGALVHARLRPGGRVTL